MSQRIIDNLPKWGFDVANNTNAMLAYWDKNLICRFANKAYIDWFGVDPETMIDKMHIAELLGALYTKNLPYIKEALNGKPQVFEREIKTASGEIRQSIANYCPDIEEEEVKGFYVHVADVTFLKKQLETDVDEAGNSLLTTFSKNTLESVENNLRDNIFIGFPGIERLAKEHFISASKLKRDFKKKYKLGINAYFRNLQMELAYNYITRNNYSKKQAALLFKFSNPSNFSVCYQKYVQERNNRQAIDEITRMNDERYKIFIAQCPFSIAMFDDNMRFLTASLKWLERHRLTTAKIAGKSLYDIFPEVYPRWSKVYEECLQGNINTGEEPFILKDQKLPTWIKWDIRPWYKNNKEVGGLLIYTEDTTSLRLKEEENKKLLQILNKTTEMENVGV